MGILKWAMPTASSTALRLHALVPCAGSGSRAGTAMPKQYHPLAGQPLVQHTLRALGAVQRLSTLLVAVAPGDRALDEMPGLRGLPGLVRAECGGPTRAATVAAGLRALRERGAADADWVLVHDAARCLVTPALVDRLIDACLDDPVGGLLAQPLADTLKRGEADTHAAPAPALAEANAGSSASAASAFAGPAGASQPKPATRIAATVPREDLWLAQTPQMFRLGPLLAALEAAEARGLAITDEASAMEAAGHAPRLVPGSPHNIKVTWPEDFALAEVLLAQRRS